VTTGYPKSTSEIVDLAAKGDNVCKNWPDHPMVLYGATGGLIGNTVLICGGYGSLNSSYSKSYLDDCYSMTSQKVTLVTHMSVKRYHAASIVLNDNTLWVTGGKNSGGSLASTEYVTISGTLPGPDLPTTLFQHAMVAINSTCSMVIGGTKRSYSSGYSASTYYYDHVKGCGNTGCGVF
jgi:N-acetylneuraminic acid mutarotase